LLSVTRHAQETDAGNLACCVEAEQQTGCIAALEDKLHLLECLIRDRPHSHNLGMSRRRPIVVRLEVPGHSLHCSIRELGAVVGGQLRTVDLTSLHLGEPFKRKSVYCRP
jgi:hypothetical protein